MTLVDAVRVSTTSSTKTHIQIILDETGSMGDVLDATISSFNEFIKDQQKNTTDECRVGITLFSEFTTPYFSTFGGFPTYGTSSAEPKQILNSVRHLGIKPLAEVVPLSKESYRPTGMTNLYDAIGETINRLDEEVPGGTNILVVIITDGHENSSRKYNLQTIHSMITEREKRGWTFVYLGANQDAWQVGASMGLAKGQTLTYDVGAIDQTLNTLSVATSAYRSTRSADTFGMSYTNFFTGDGNETR